MVMVAIVALFADMVVDVVVVVAMFKALVIGCGPWSWS